jgi:nitrite reductase/ring-hydroxylating ferredoxin subunit
MADDAPGEPIRVALGDLSKLTEGEVHTCTADRFDVMLCRVAGRLYALEDVCSHADTTLSDGLLRGHVITCPLHGAQFDVRDGSHLGPPAYTGVTSFVIDESDGDTVIEIPPKQAFDPGFGTPGGIFKTR